MIVYINRNVTVHEIERNIPVIAFDGEWFFGFFFIAFFYGEPHVAFWFIVKGLHQFLTFEKSIFFVHISIVYCSKNNFLKLYGRIINSRITVSIKSLIL